MSILSDVKEGATRVRDAMHDGPVTPYYSLPLKDVSDVMQGALASVIICALRYQQHYYMTTSLHQQQLQDVFKEHSHDKRVIKAACG